MKISNCGTRVFCAVSTAAAVMLATGAQAQVTATSGNSTITVNTNSAINKTMTSWVVGNTAILNQQSFFYRIGSGNNVSISTIPLTGLSVNGGLLDMSYATSTFSLNILYSLVGGSASSGASDLSEQISIQNLGSSTITGFHFYQYASFIGAGNVTLSQNSRNLFNEAYAANGTMSVTESVDADLTPANEGQTDAGVLANILAGGTLNNSTTSTTGQWGLEWDETIAGNGTVILSKDLGAVVPEPPAWALLAVGMVLGGLQMYRRRATAPAKALARVRAK